MKNNLLFASTTALLNTLALYICSLPIIASNTDTKQAALNISQILSPFLALWLNSLYVKIDQPPELIKAEAAIKKAIKICEKHLKQQNTTEDFRTETRKRLSDLMLKQQTLRMDFQQGKVYTSSLPTVSPSGEGES